MPKLKNRGRVLRYRTIKLSPTKYAHLEVYSKEGKRGGHTVLGKIKNVRTA